VRSPVSILLSTPLKPRKPTPRPRAPVRSRPSQAERCRPRCCYQQHSPERRAFESFNSDSPPSRSDTGRICRRPSIFKSSRPPSAVPSVEPLIIPIEPPPLSTAVTKPLRRASSDLNDVPLVGAAPPVATSSSQLCSPPTLAPISATLIWSRARKPMKEPSLCPSAPCFCPSFHNVSPTRPTPVKIANQPEWKPFLAESKKEELRRLIERSTQKFNSSATWEEFVNKCKNPRGDLHPDVQHLPHRAAHMLSRLRVSGATVATKSAPWTLQQKLAALARGFHQSAKQHVDFLCGEFVNMIQKGQWILLPSKLLLDNHNLRLSPLGVVPQRDRRPRTICDYSFFLVNDDTIELCPEQSMQFGRALLRILQKIAHSDPRLGPVYLSKIDIADGFYRIAIRSNDVPKLAIMLPTAEGEEPLVGLPLVLPMGWKQSPPLFTAATETVADLANTKLTDMKPSVPHRLDLLSKKPIRFEPPPPVSAQGPAPPPPANGQTPLAS
jgi:hypothetical protein